MHHSRHTGLFIALLFSTAIAGAEDYPPGTFRITPRFELELQPVPVLVPDHFDHLPEGLSLNLPPGFSARMYASFPSVDRPRFMAFDDEGVLHVANMDDDQIVALPDHDGDGFADEAIVVARSFSRPHSIAFFNGDLYVGDRPEIVRLQDLDDDGIYEKREQFAGDIPASGSHSTRTLVIDEAGEKMYLSVGWPCDVCRNNDSERGSILQFNLDGSGRRIFASGVRNVVGMAVHPVTGALWGTNNGHDREGVEAPPEWIDIIRNDGFYGIPFAYGYQKWIDFTIPSYKDKMLPLTQADSLRVASMQPPAALVPAHTAPMGIHFYDHDQFPSQYRHAGFIALHAGHAKLAPIEGYSVIALFAEPDGSQARLADFITGFQTGTEIEDVWGFPMGITTDAAGNLYISLDLGNRGILRIEHSPIIANFEHNLPDTLHAGASINLELNVHLERLATAAEPPVVSADLSALGGPAQVPLDPVGDESFSLQLPLTTPMGNEGGRRTISLTVRQNAEPQPHEVRLTKTVALMPSSQPVDLVIFAEELAPGWTVEHKTWLESLSSDLREDAFVKSGEVSASFRGISGDWDWVTRFKPDHPIDLVGYGELRFALHPGPLDRSGELDFNVYAAGTLVNLSRDGLVDMNLKEWQEVVLPLQMFGSKPLKEITFGGDFTGRYYLDDVLITAASPATAVATTAQTPTGFALEANYPNPFNNSTVIPFRLGNQTKVRLQIYNLTGQKVARLLDERREAGAHAVQWSGEDDAGRSLASGVYFYRLEADELQFTRKLVLLR